MQLNEEAEEDDDEEEGNVRSFQEDTSGLEH